MSFQEIVTHEESKKISYPENVKTIFFAEFCNELGYNLDIYVTFEHIFYAWTKLFLEF